MRCCRPKSPTRLSRGSIRVPVPTLRTGAMTLLVLFVVAGWAVVAAGAAAAPATAGAATTAAGHELHVSPSLEEILALENGRTYKTMLIILQVATILVAAKLTGWLAEMVRVPGVVGELLAGALIGPYLLGGLIPVPLHGHWVPLFPPPTRAGQWPVNDSLWSLSQFASVVLLFIAGLHTDLKQVLRYLAPA